MPEASSLVTQVESKVQVPGHVVWKAPAVVGKSFEGRALPLKFELTFAPVVPVTYTFPEESTAMPKPISVPLPPRNVEYTSDAAPDFVGSILATKASQSPLQRPSVPHLVWTAPVVTGKSEESVQPVM